MNTFCSIILAALFICYAHCLPVASESLLQSDSPSQHDDNNWLSSIIPNNYTKQLAPQDASTLLSMYFLQFHDYDENTKPQYYSLRSDYGPHFCAARLVGMSFSSVPSLKNHLRLIDKCLLMQDIKNFYPPTQVTCDLYLRFHWKDNRLHSNTTPHPAIIRTSPAAVLKDDLWIPDIFIVNAIKYELAGGPNSFLQLNRTDGALLFSQKIQVRIPCKSVGNEIRCPLQFESYGYHSTELPLDFKNEPKYSNDDVTIQEMPVKELTHERKEIKYQSNTYSRLDVVFKFEKNIEVTVEKLISSHHN